MRIVGIGTEIVECLRIARLIERHGDLFLRRVFTQHEIEFCRARKAATQHYAGRWAAKEAVLKTLSAQWSSEIRWRDIEVRGGEGRSPRVAMGGGARRACERLGVGQMQLSISVCRTHACAFALALAAPTPDDTGPSGEEDQM